MGAAELDRRSDPYLGSLLMLLVGTGLNCCIQNCVAEGHDDFAEGHDDFVEGHDCFAEGHDGFA